MLTEAQQSQLKTITRTLQIIVLGMAGGVFAFMVVATVIGAQQPGGDPLLTYVGAGFAVLAVILWCVVPGVAARKARQAIVDGREMDRPTTFPSTTKLGIVINAYLALKPDTKTPGPKDTSDVGMLGNAYCTRTIVAVALLEGSAFFNLIAYLMEGKVLSLILAGVLLVMILMHFPWQSKIADWVQGELITIDQLRQMQTYDGR